jgi:AraC family transcriptional regulator
MPEQDDRLSREYRGRINRVIDHVYANLDRPLPLEELAAVACFSPYHFHRIFSVMTGETIGGFIRRVRLERAASALIGPARPAVTEVALAVGFSSPSVFARAFRERFGVSATVWRAGAWRSYRKDGKADRKDRQADGKDGEAPEAGSPYSWEHKPEVRRIDMSRLKYSVEVKELPERHVAYVRHTGPYNQIGTAFERLMRWAGPRGLAAGPDALHIAVYHDDTKVTEEARLRSSACVTVPPGTAVDGEVGLMTIPGGRFAVGHFEIAADQFGDAWAALLGEWFPSSGYQGDERMCYELYLNDPAVHPEHRFLVDICEPAKPL